MRAPLHFLIAGLLLAFQAFGACADPWVIEPVNVIDVDTGEVLENRSVLVRDGRVHAVGPAGTTRSDNIKVIEGRSGYLIPGLAEMHAHVPSHERGEQYVQDVLTLFLANGVTTIRGMLGEPWHLELRRLLAESAWEGPRLVTSGPSFNGNSVNSPAEAVHMVREQAAAGYDFLKIHPGLKPGEFQALARTAREADIPFAGHVSFEVGLEAALAEGQAAIDHLDAYAEAMVPPESDLAGQAPRFFGLNLGAAMDPGLAPRLARATREAGVWVVPTQSLFETTAGKVPIEDLMSRPGMDMLSAELAQNWRRAVMDIRSQAPESQRTAFLTARRALIDALAEAGAGILLGSDAPQIMNVPGYSVHQELRYMVDAGLTPLEALQSATIRVARFFGHADRGAVAPGNVADLVLLRENPLEDIGNTAGILGVARGGRWYDRAALDRMLNGVRERGI